jgi:hypothetical protein
LFARTAFFIVVALICQVSAAADQVTYSKQVAPILWNNCASCHRPGEIGPFPLLTYKDAAKRADFIKQVTQDRRMPPWKPDAVCQDFRDPRRLSDADIKTLAAWADAGAPEGDPKDLPPQPHFVDGWQLGKPDLVLAMPKEFSIPADGPDIYRCFVLKIPIDKDVTVAATEFRPGNRRVVHHALFFLDSLGQARRKDGRDGQPGYTSFGGIGVLPTGGLGGWAPGTIPRRLPEGTGMGLAKGSDLVLSIHYHPDGKPEKDLSQVGIYFTPKPAEKIVGGIAIRSRSIYIPAGDSHHEVHAETQPLPTDVKSLGIFPHMHLLGREMKATAWLPNGEKQVLIWIRDWDFNWQGSYQFVKPVSLPKGTVIKVDAVYDNSADNPKNPNSPPKAVRWGEQTTDEMCLCGMTVVTETPADLRKVRAMNYGALGAILGGGSLPLGEKNQDEDDILKRLPKEGFVIPESSRAILTPFDKNHDGRIDRSEIEAMPSFIRSRVVKAIGDKMDSPEAKPKK